MVRKRTLTFATLAILIWALTATGFMAYYYLQHLTYSEQLQQKQKLLDEFTRSSEDSLTKWNLLAANYGSVHGEYQLPEKNYTSLMDKYEKLMINLKENYTDLLNTSPELNETYNLLSQKYHTLNQQTVIEDNEFGELLSEFDKLFTSMALKEIGKSISEVTTIQVDLLIDYGNTTSARTSEWYNISIPLGTTLFNLTQTVAKIEYYYYATMEPGHILIMSINDSAEGYWLWYYWDEDNGKWVFGPVGCDAWMLEDGRVYKWLQS